MMVKRFFKKWGNWIAVVLVVIGFTLNDIAGLTALPVIFGTNAFAGVDTAFKRGDGASSETFTAIAEVNSIDGPNLSRDTIDVTSLDSSGGYREFIGGFRDGGEITLEMNFTLDGFDDLKNDLESSDTVNYQIVFSDSGNTTLDFAGFVTAIGIATQADDKVTATTTIKITGEVTITS